MSVLAGDGAPAVDTAGTWILMDTVMPCMNGFEALCALTADLQMRATSVIMVSGT